LKERGSSRSRAGDDADVEEAMCGRCCTCLCSEASARCWSDLTAPSSSCRGRVAARGARSEDELEDQPSGDARTRADRSGRTCSRTRGGRACSSSAETRPATAPAHPPGLPRREGREWSHRTVVRDPEEPEENGRGFDTTGTGTPMRNSRIFRKRCVSGPRRRAVADGHVQIAVIDAVRSARGIALRVTSR